MTSDLISSLSLTTPELIIAIGALVLLMVGAYSREASSGAITGLAVAILIVAGGWMLFVSGEGNAFGSASYRTRLPAS